MPGCQPAFLLKIQKWGFRVKGFGFRVWDLGFGVLGLGFRGARGTVHRHTPTHPGTPRHTPSHANTQAQHIARRHSTQHAARSTQHAARSTQHTAHSTLWKVGANIDFFSGDGTSNLKFASTARTPVQDSFLKACFGTFAQTNIPGHLCLDTTHFGHLPWTLALNSCFGLLLGFIPWTHSLDIFFAHQSWALSLDTCEIEGKIRKYKRQTGL